MESYDNYSGHRKMSVVERFTLFGESVIGGSTVYVYGYIPYLPVVCSNTDPSIYKQASIAGSKFLRKCNYTVLKCNKNYGCQFNLTAHMYVHMYDLITN